MTSVLVHMLRQPLGKLQAFTPRQPLKQANLYPPPQMQRPMWLRPAAVRPPPLALGAVVPAAIGMGGEEAAVPDAAFEVVDIRSPGGVVLAAAAPFAPGPFDQPRDVAPAARPKAAPEAAVNPGQYPILARLAASGWEALKG